MSKVSNRLSELKAKNVSKRCFNIAERRIKNGYNGHIDLLIADCSNTVNFEDDHYSY